MQERLFRIVQMLMKRRHMTARELAEELEVSTRTIYRDLDALTLGGYRYIPKREKTAESFWMNITCCPRR